MNVLKMDSLPKLLFLFQTLHILVPTHCIRSQLGSCGDMAALDLVTPRSGGGGGWGDVTDRLFDVP